MSSYNLDDLSDEEFSDEFEFSDDTDGGAGNTNDPEEDETGSKEAQGGGERSTAPIASIETDASKQNSGKFKFPSKSKGQSKASANTTTSGRKSSYDLDDSDSADQNDGYDDDDFEDMDTTSKSNTFEDDNKEKEVHSRSDKDSTLPSPEFASDANGFKISTASASASATSSPLGRSGEVATASTMPTASEDSTRRHEYEPNVTVGPKKIAKQRNVNSDGQSNADSKRSEITMLVPSTTNRGISLATSSSVASKTNKNDPELVEKLRVANRALREQLKEFARALDASLKQNTAAAAGHTLEEDYSRSAKARAKVMKVMQKKLKMYKRITAELKQQLVSAQRKDRVLELKNQAKEQERKVQALMDENRSLLAIQRHQSRKIHQRESVRQDWPQRLQSMENEIRIYREKLRKVRQRDLKFAETRKWQDSQIRALKTKVKKLNKKLGNTASDSDQVSLPGVHASRQHDNTSEYGRESQSALASCQEENAKLRKDVALLKRTMNNDRTRYEKDLKRQKAEIQRLKNQNEEQQEDMLRKEKLVKMQVLQVKRLKRQLKDLVRSATPIAVPQEVPTYKIPSKPRSSKKPSPLKSGRATRPTPHLAKGADRPSKAQSKPGILTTDNNEREGNAEAEGEFTFLTGGAGILDEIKKDEKKPRKRAGGTMKAVTDTASEGDADEHNAATKVQTQFRGVRSRRFVKKKREHETRAASKLQSQIRGRNARRKVKKHRKQVDRAATRLQSNFRGYRDRRKISATKDQRERDLAFEQQLEYKLNKKNPEPNQRKRNVQGKTSISESVSSPLGTEADANESFSKGQKPVLVSNSSNSKTSDTTLNSSSASLAANKDTTNIASLDSALVEDDQEWDDDDLAAALDGPVPKVISFGEQKSESAIPNKDQDDTISGTSSFSFPKAKASLESDTPGPKESKVQEAQPVQVARFGPGRKKKKKKYY